VPSPAGNLAPNRPCLIGERESRHCNAHRKEEGHENRYTVCASGDAGQPAATLRTCSGAAERGRGTQTHATYSISMESYRENTGDPREEEKAGGSRKARAQGKANASLGRRKG